MGVDYRAYTVVGVRIEFKHLPAVVERQRGCGHPETPTNYCGVCGKPMWVDRDATADKMQLLRDWADWPESDRVVKTPEGYTPVYVYDEKTLYFGRATKALYLDSKHTHIPTSGAVAEIAETVERVLTVLGVWTPLVRSTFGIWTVQEVSG